LKGRKELSLLEQVRIVLDVSGDFVVKVATWFVACFMGGMVISILLAIISRFIIKIPIPWTEELSRYLMIWTAFIAGSLGLKRGVHVGINFVVQRVPEKASRWIGLITNISLLFFFLVLIIEGFHLTILVAGQMSPVLRVSMAWVYSSLPVGAALFTFFVIQLVVEDLRGLWNKKAD
jgi:TRAP-type C4-dicarboxylate transport system permease small subunit